MDLPRRFIELSVESMKDVKGEVLNVHGEIFQDSLVNGDDEDSIYIGDPESPIRVIQVRPIRDDTPIIAIDASNVKIGETERGILCAVRGAVIWNRKRRYRYIRIGPFPFYINAENRDEILHLLRKHHIPASNSSSLTEIQIKLGSLIENWIQINVCRSSNRSIILIDGSLTANRNSDSLNMYMQMLRSAREKENSILAFSKMTKLRVLGRRILDLHLKYRPPWILTIDDFQPFNLHLLGDIYIAKFTERGYSFRVDIDHTLPDEEKIRAVKRLLGNDSVFQSYPESLRLAHIYSTFTANEVIGIQRFISQQFGIKIISQHNFRRSLFGPYGTEMDD